MSGRRFPAGDRFASGDRIGATNEREHIADRDARQTPNLEPAQMPGVDQVVDVLTSAPNGLSGLAGRVGEAFDCRSGGWNEWI